MRGRKRDKVRDEERIRKCVQEIKKRKESTNMILDVPDVCSTCNKEYTRPWRMCERRLTTWRNVGQGVKDVEQKRTTVEKFEKNFKKSRETKLERDKYGSRRAGRV